MNERIVTYSSQSPSRPSMTWIAFIEQGKGNLPIYFSAETELAAYTKADEFWKEGETKREQTRKNREEGRLKAALRAKNKEQAQ